MLSFCVWVVWCLTVLLFVVAFSLGVVRCLGFLFVWGWLGALVLILFLDLLFCFWGVLLSVSVEAVWPCSPSPSVFRCGWVPCVPFFVGPLLYLVGGWQALSCTLSGMIGSDCSAPICLGMVRGHCPPFLFLGCPPLFLWWLLGLDLLLFLLSGGCLVPRCIFLRGYPLLFLLWSGAYCPFLVGLLGGLVLIFFLERLGPSPSSLSISLYLFRRGWAALTSCSLSGVSSFLSL